METLTRTWLVWTLVHRPAMQSECGDRVTPTRGMVWFFWSIDLFIQLQMVEVWHYNFETLSLFWGLFIFLFLFTASILLLNQAIFITVIFQEFLSTKTISGLYNNRVCPLEIGPWFFWYPTIFKNLSKSYFFLPTV